MSFVSQPGLRHNETAYGAFLAIALFQFWEKDLETASMSVSFNPSNLPGIIKFSLSDFISLSIISGIGSWNMPELNWYWGYPFCLGVMVAIALTLIIYFWRRGWLKNVSPIR